MTSKQEWLIDFYVDERGDSPVEAYIESLDDKTQNRLAWSIEELRLRNIHARTPLVKRVDGKLWELREESGKNIYRIVYFFFTGRRIVLLHGFQKKTQKTPSREIEIAQKRMDDFLRREGN